MIELYVEFEQHTGMSVVGAEVNVDELGDIDWEEDNNDSEEDYTISRGVDYTVYESKRQTFYAKCKGYGARRYNGKHMCTMGTISQDHAKLDSDTIVNAISIPSIKVKFIIVEVQSKFNYTISYCKKSIATIFGDWKVSYQTLPVWLKAMTARMPRSHEALSSIDSIGAMRCLRFGKCKMVPFTLLTLCNDTVIVAISRSSDSYVTTFLHVALTNILIGNYMCIMCTRCLKFTRCTEASLFRWVTHLRGIDMKERR
ncbi:hypothetical protein Ahy_A03g014453 [Arachis hypogaea]|uniref:Uncharacterized protein n=1 Tax=Arachis hypogaea TaxID=3818 RepID=A0A445DY31_ARAHY|nr:hypothetical protein Ahy_A03g014453 [Arachis hypogaea]